MHRNSGPLQTITGPLYPNSERFFHFCIYCNIPFFPGCIFRFLFAIALFGKALVVSLVYYFGEVFEPTSLSLSPLSPHFATPVKKRLFLSSFLFKSSCIPKRNGFHQLCLRYKTKTTFFILQLREILACRPRLALFNAPPPASA